MKREFHESLYHLYNNESNNKPTEQEINIFNNMIEYLFKKNKQINESQINNNIYGYSKELLRILYCIYHKNKKTILLDEAMRSFHPRLIKKFYNYYQILSN